MLKYYCQCELILPIYLYYQYEPPGRILIPYPTQPFCFRLQTSCAAGTRIKCFPGYNTIQSCRFHPCPLSLYRTICSSNSLTYNLINPDPLSISGHEACSPQCWQPLSSGARRRRHARATRRVLRRRLSHISRHRRGARRLRIL